MLMLAVLVILGGGWFLIDENREWYRFLRSEFSADTHHTMD